MMPPMECKPVFRRMLNGWACECTGTEAGFGATAEAAYHDWLSKFSYTHE